MKNELCAAKYFLGANTPAGFFSKFDQLYDPMDGWFLYIIKGGPGTGKSTLMKNIAKFAISKNVETELIYCSSDPNSLDAVIFPTLKTCIVDGTAPHTMDPKFPGVSDTIINLSDCWDKKKLRSNREAVILNTLKNSSFHKKSQNYLEAYGILNKNTEKILSNKLEVKKIINYSNNLSKKLFPMQKKQRGKEYIRFLSGITPNGITVFDSTLSLLSDNIYVVIDKYGVCANILMQNLKNNALNCGIDTIACYCPISPNNKIDFLIFPEIKTSFAVSNNNHNMENISNLRKIHCKRFINKDVLQANQQKIKFNQKLQYELLSEAIYNLRMAKAVHDELEKSYIECMDFSLVDKLSKTIASEILK